MEIFAVFSDPDRYATPIPIGSIVADDKVFRKGVERYKDMILEGDAIGTIIVVRHPTDEIFAVLDGHHRFWAQKELGFCHVNCAIIHDFYGLNFQMTKRGMWQPSAEFTEKVRVPLIKWGAELSSYLKDFLKDPFGLERARPENIETDEKLDDDDLI